jgi:Flp pilus assembly protein TadD
MGIAGGLLLLVLGTYLPVGDFDFVNYDDPLYVAANPHVTAGWSADGVRWAFTTLERANWQPLTWLSLMADRPPLGPGEDTPLRHVPAGPYHWTNVLLHLASSLILFGLLKRITGASGPSALAAFLFAMHPQHVESVAWVAERKDVLCALFWMLALWSYVSYVRRPKTGTYLLTLLLYCLGLMAKPMVITLPLVFLLLDVWPLERFPITAAGGRGKLARKLVLEKLPFFALALAMSVTTYVAQQRGGAVRTFEESPLGSRLGNALISGAVYVGKTLWPTRLAVFYPLPAKQPVWQVMAAGLVLAGITVLALRFVRTRPYLAVGWFWYLITILPVIGIVQVGTQARADRYTYLPSIGLSLMLAWSGADAWRRWPKARPAMAGLCGVACVALVALTARQIAYWENSVTLFRHAIEVTRNNDIAHGCLGDAWYAQSLNDEAISEYRKAIEINPHYVAALENLGAALGAQGRTGEAIAPLTEAARLWAGDARIQVLLGAALASEGRSNEALPHLEAALRLMPDDAVAHSSLGIALLNLGRNDEAIAQFTEALRIQPRFGEARWNLQKAWAAKDRAGKQ